ncbi:MAG: hypothetical protein AAF533_13085 [Acidobacteriota bacterium]
MWLFFMGVLLAAWACLRLSSRSVNLPAGAAEHVMAFLLPALWLLGTLLLIEKDGTRVRFALVGLGFDEQASDPGAVTIGGDRREHDVWVDSIPARHGGPERTEDGEEAARGDCDDGRDSPHDSDRLVDCEDPDCSADPACTRVGVLEAGDGSFTLKLPDAPAVGVLGRGPTDLVSGVALEDGDVLSLGGDEWTHRWDGRRHSFLSRLDGHQLEIPPRMTSLPILGWEREVSRPLSVARRTHPVDWLRTGGQSNGERQLRSFLYFDASAEPGSDLRLAFLDPDLSLARRGESIPRVEKVTLRDGERLNVMALPRAGSGDFLDGGVRDQRSFRVYSAERSVMLHFDTPEIHVFTWAELAELSLHRDRDVFEIHVDTGFGQLARASISFDAASRQVGGEAFAVLELPSAWRDATPLAGQKFRHVSPRGVRSVQLGEPFWLGERHRAALQVDVLSPPTWLGLLGVVLAIVKAATSAALRVSRGGVLVLASVEFLLALRVVLGVRVHSMPPFSEEARLLALIAWGVVPWVLLAASLGIRHQAEEIGRTWHAAVGLLTAGLVLAGTWSWVLQEEGLVRMAWLGCIGLGMVVPVLRWAWRWCFESEQGFELAERLRGAPQWVGLTAWTVAALAWVAIRVVLALSGIKEAVQLGGGTRLALSIIHVPVLIGLTVFLFKAAARDLEERGRPGWFVAGGLLFLIAGPWGLVSVLTNDLGLALMNVPVLLVALAVFGLRARSSDAIGTRAWTVIPVAALAVYLACAVLPFGSRIVVAMVGNDTELLWERNYLRVLGHAYPERLTDVGTKSSEELAIMTEVMSVYSSGPAGGRGHGRSELSPHVKATALREHVPIVFITSEWGLLGSLGVMLAQLVLAATFCFAPWRGLGQAQASGEMGAIAACLGGLTIGVPSLLMLAANHGLGLFTGKNAYLLGLDSAGDVIELVVLAVLTLGAAAVARDREPA